MSKNMQRLGATLSKRMKQTSRDAVGIDVELGTVNANLSITPDSLRASIPKGEYMINLMLTGGLKTSSASHTHDGGDHTHSGGAHSHNIPAAFRGIEAGDRVLIAWCGTEPVVVAIVASS